MNIKKINSKSLVCLRFGFCKVYLCTTKGGVLMLTKALATKWAKHGITINAIGSAYFESEVTEKTIGSDEFGKIVKAYCPMGRIGRQGELDGALIYFASDASSYTTG
ncbi:SDR family oxidoreductase [Alkaliphilus flagellatus]|nr:SDR family oxidoreductase [Alkaliphilus flagellatus]